MYGFVKRELRVGGRGDVRRRAMTQETMKKEAIVCGTTRPLSSRRCFCLSYFHFSFLYYDRGGNGVRYNEMFLWQCFFHFSLFYNDKGGLLCVVKRDLSPQEVYLSLFFFFLHFLCYHKRGNSVW